MSGQLFPKSILYMFSYYKKISLEFRLFIQPMALASPRYGQQKYKGLGAGQRLSELRLLHQRQGLQTGP